MNLLLVHVLSNMLETTLDKPCRIGIDAPIPLSQVIDGYVAHCEDVLAQILMRG